MRPTDKLEQLYTGDEKKILHEQEMVEMIEEPLPPGEPAGDPEKNPITGEDMKEEEEEMEEEEMEEES
jgi:hypothetical protein